MDFNLNGIVNFLMFINDNWVSIVVLVGVVIGIAQKVIAFVKTNQDKKVEVAKAQAKETIKLKLNIVLGTKRVKSNGQKLSVRFIKNIPFSRRSSTKKR